MAKKGNQRRDLFLKTVSQEISINTSDNDLAHRSKFNFSYFVGDDQAGQDFSDWSKEELSKLLDKLKEYSKKPLDYWKTQKVGRYTVLVNYGSFPKKTDFKKPKHIPMEAEWCRFHLENKPRLIGFVIPDEYHNTKHAKTDFLFDKNTFYAVFLDRDHRFYKTKR